MSAALFATKRFDANVYQVFRDGQQIGCAIKYATGQWFLHDRDDRKQWQHGAHATPQALAKHLAADCATLAKAEAQP